jgi:hypothetical protein
MTQRSPVIEWFCLSVLLCFLSFSISAAKDANKTPDHIQPTSPQSSAEPDRPDSKGGEAAAVANAAKLYDMNNETVKRIETFYANTVQDFETHFSMGVVTLVVAVMGAVGAASVFILARRVAKRQANKALGPTLRQSTQVLSEFETIKKEFETIKNAHQTFSIARQKELQEFEALRSKYTEVNDTALKKFTEVHEIALKNVAPYQIQS